MFLARPQPKDSIFCKGSGTQAAKAVEYPNMENCPKCGRPTFVRNGCIGVHIASSRFPK